MEPTEQVPPTLLPEDGNRPSFQNTVFFWILDDGEVQKLSNFMCYTPV
jgi:hypothetical protein